MNNRFEVRRKNKVFYVYDSENFAHRTSPMAVNIYFELLDNATTVCDILNQEWNEFLRNPT